MALGMLEKIPIYPICYLLKGDYNHECCRITQVNPKPSQSDCDGRSRSQKVRTKKLQAATELELGV